jgi:glycosyltransferase involved in cell wall biosynthesis
MLSFIIPTLNEEEHMGPLLESLVPQMSDNDEIIIVDSFSKDKTVEIAKQFDAKILEQPKKGIGLAKTAGARQARNDIFVFMDADCTVPEGFVDKLNEHFSDPRVRAVGGLDLYHSNSRIWKTVYDSYSRSIFYSSKITHAISGKYWIPANNCAYRRDTFFSVGGYRSVVCEDTDMMIRMPASKNVIFDSSLELTLSDRRFKQNGFFRTIIHWGWSNISAFVSDGISTDGYRSD